MLLPTIDFLHEIFFYTFEKCRGKHNFLFEMVDPYYAQT